VRKVSLWWGIVASTALVAAQGCKTTTSSAPPVANNPVNGSGTRSAMVATGDDPTSLNTKTPPPGPDLYVSTARVYEGTQNFEAAQGQYERALKIDPKYLPALLGYARLLDTQKQFNEADKFYQKAVKLHPEVAAVYNDWGMSQQRRGNLQESAKLLTKATQLQPDKALYRNNLAMVLVVLNRPQEAYRQLAAIESPSVAHFNLGALLHRAGDERAAAFQFAEASKADPSWDQARQWAERLGGAGVPATSAIAQTSQPQVPPPDPRPDPVATAAAIPAAAPAMVAQRAEIVDQAFAPLPPTAPSPTSPSPTSQAIASQPLPQPAPPPTNDAASYYAASSDAPANRATIVNPAASDGLPAFAGVAPGPAITPPSAISYPAQYALAGSPAAGSAGSPEPLAIEPMPPLPPGETSSGTGLAPLPPVR